VNSIVKEERIDENCFNDDNMSLAMFSGSDFTLYLFVEHIVNLNCCGAFALSAA
jgi:hypothetical protein